MKFFVIICFVSILIIPDSFSQKVWTLENCIDYALENNIQIKRFQLVSETARNNFNQSRLSVLPGVGAQVNHDLNSGRALNTDTYQWENREFEQGSLGAQAQMNIFNGFQGYNNIQQHRYLLLSSLEEVDRAMNDISMRITSEYFQILLDMELVDIAENQLKASSLEMESARSNFRLGNISRGGLLEIESQVASNEYQLTLAINNLSSSYLTLKQTMQLDHDLDFEIYRPEIDTINESAVLNRVDVIYDQAETNLPQVRGAEYFLRSAERGLARARGMQSPRLAVRGTYYSRYSELALDPMTGGSYSYPAQIKDNQYKQLGFSLIVPIFDGWSIRNRISNSKIAVLDASYQLDAARQELYSEIHQMHNEAKNALNRYNSAEKAAISAEEAFNFAQQQFRLGLINFVDFQLSQSNLFRAQSNMAQAKYEYYLRSMILDFYRGEALAMDN
jgi:outer membrane protein